MALANIFYGLVGNWHGLNKLWLSPDDPVRESETCAWAAFMAQEKFFTFRYTWFEGEKPQDGTVIIGQEGNNEFKAIWFDSWHMGNQAMQCHGHLEAESSLSVLGSYAPPSGPDWGWRIQLQRSGLDEITVRMYNILPDGREFLAVEAIYHRKPPVIIIPYQSRWSDEFQDIATILRQGLGRLAVRIDHIGSTSVPRLAAKDVIDIQITVSELGSDFLAAMQAIGYARNEGNWGDHCPEGFDGPESEWEKWYFRPPEGQRRTHIHVRVQGRANQRYPLLFRDYLRTHPATAQSYAELKRRLSQNLADPLTYPEVKDPAVDLIYRAAEEWAATKNWKPSPSDA